MNCSEKLELVKMENKEKNKYIGNAYNKLVEMLEKAKKENEEKDKTLEERQRFINLEAKKLDHLNKAIYSLKKEVKKAYKLIKTQNIINLKISGSYLDDITKWKDACSRLSTRGINDMKHIDQLKMHHLSDDWAIKYHTLETENKKLKIQIKKLTGPELSDITNQTFDEVIEGWCKPLNMTKDEILADFKKCKEMHLREHPDLYKHKTENEMEKIVILGMYKGYKGRLNSRLGKGN